MRISDWSSDVCSSDLSWTLILLGQQGPALGEYRVHDAPDFRPIHPFLSLSAKRYFICVFFMQREQERGFRRDGSDQGVSPCDISRNIMPTPGADAVAELPQRSEEHTSELQSLMRISYAV